MRRHQIHLICGSTGARVEARNAEKGDTYQLGFDVTREMFDFVESIWEPPTEAEMLAYDGVRASALLVAGIANRNTAGTIEA